MPRGHPSRAALERLLGGVFGDAALIGWRAVGPWAVLRASRDGQPSSVIVKWPRDAPGGARSDAAQPATEHVALRFLDDLGLRVAPRALGADLGAGVLVLEDLAPRESLAAVLVSDPGGADAVAGLRGLAACFGRLHAGTVGRAGRYHRRRARLGPVDPGVERRRFFSPWPDVRALAGALDVPLPGGAERDLAAAIGELTEPGPFLALSNGDAAANNVLVDGGADGRPIDFEFAGFRHCLCDLACLYVPGPMRGGLVYAVFRLGRLGLLDGRGPGDRSRLQMVATLEAAAGVAARFGAVPHLAGWARRAADALRRRWPDADADVAALRAYTPRHAARP